MRQRRQLTARSLMKAASLGRKYVLVSVSTASAPPSPERSSSAAIERNSSAFADKKPAGEPAKGEQGAGCSVWINGVSHLAAQCPGGTSASLARPRAEVCTSDDTYSSSRSSSLSPTNYRSLAAAGCHAQHQAQQCPCRHHRAHDAAACLQDHVQARRWRHGSG